MPHQQHRPSLQLVRRAGGTRRDEGIEPDLITGYSKYEQKQKEQARQSSYMLAPLSKAGQFNVKEMEDGARSEQAEKASVTPQN